MNDIYTQLDRINRAYMMQPTASDMRRNRGRMLRAEAAADRYARNIANQASYLGAARSGPRRTAEDFNNARRKADSIKYSRSTYMGLNNG